MKGLHHQRLNLAELALIEFQRLLRQDVGVRGEETDPLAEFKKEKMRMAMSRSIPGTAQSCSISALRIS